MDQLIYNHIGKLIFAAEAVLGLAIIRFIACKPLENN